MPTPLTDDQREKKLLRREHRTRANMLRVYEACAKTLVRLFLPVGDPNRHPDADKTWSECSMQTRSALTLAKVEKENPQAAVKDLFGIVIMQARAKDPLAWEAAAAKIDTKQKQAALDAIAITKREPK